MGSTQTLRRLALESVAIVGSILLAFAIDAWWAKSEEAVKRDALMRNLKAEITANILALERITQAQTLHAQKVLRYVRILNGAEPSPPVDELDTLKYAIIIHPTYHPSFGVLDVLIQSGSLILLQNPELQAELADLKSFVSYYTDNQEALVTLTASDAARYNTGSYIYPFRLPEREDGSTSRGRDELETAMKVAQTVYGFYVQTLEVQGQEVLAKFREVYDFIP
ncbi:hypothetical protein [Congregibacter sp.]|uniref:hypothetical protein n=1 Tax=Congregibacter sp. TaxID=2744308 RepID=UPI0038582F8B